MVAAALDMNQSQTRHSAVHQKVRLKRYQNDAFTTIEALRMRGRIYGQASYDLASARTLTIGDRYPWEKRKQDAFGANAPAPVLCGRAPIVGNGRIAVFRLLFLL